MDSLTTLRLTFFCALLARCARDHTPVFQGPVGQLENDGGFADFMDQNAGNVVRLDVTISKAQFQGGTEREFDFLDLFDTCDDVLNSSEAPAAPRCSGTEFLLPKPGGRSLLVQENGHYRLRGRFRLSKKTGPLQGMFSMQLEPVP